MTAAQRGGGIRSDRDRRLEGSSSDVALPWPCSQKDQQSALGGSGSHSPQPLQPPPLTSTCFLRGLRSLTILAFLAGFFSSRSLSPSPLEELAEALLSNLHEETRFQGTARDPCPNEVDGAGSKGEAAAMSTRQDLPPNSPSLQQPAGRRLPELKLLCSHLTALRGFPFHERG